MAIPTLVLRHGRDVPPEGVDVSREELAAARGAGVSGVVALPGAASGGRSSHDELPGVRSTMDKLIAQEVAGGCRPDVARAQVERVARNYHRDVASGSTPYPQRRD